ncbi:MAG: helix-turn-helix domain-containing protein [Planctomycetes bacterium]|nr:helix-turn-helix domain-containing protein [Planctomycetota bacterium]
MDNLTVKQVAQRLGISAATVYALCNRRLLSHIRIGLGRGTVRIPDLH